MKRALAILAVCSLFGGLAGMAQLSGSWDFSINLLPLFDGVQYSKFYTWPYIDYDSTFTLEYTVAGWTFTSKSIFAGPHELIPKWYTEGFTEQDFNASGQFGAVSIESEMVFLPSVPSEHTYVVYSLSSPQTPSCPLDVDFYYGDNWTPGTPKLVPALDYWKTTLSLSFAGVDSEVLMYMRSYDHFYAELWELYSGGSPTGWYLYCESAKPTGTGWRVKVGGNINGIAVTSYTYFNLDETLKLFTAEGCPQIEFKGDYKIHWDEWCGVGFNREVITFEGLGLCCGATLNGVLSISCADFDYLFLYVTDVPVFGWMNISPWVKFSIDKKEFGFCATPVTAGGCITVSPVFQMEGDKSHNQIDNKIGGVIIKEISLECKLAECIEFSLDTVLYDLKSNALLVIDGPEGLVSYDLGAYGTLYDCKPLTKYLAWEKAHFKFCGPGCCGGNFEVTMDVYFGKKYDVVWTIGGTPEGKEQPLPGGQKQVSCLPWTYSLTNEQQLDTLFGWMETDIAATVPVSADISLTLDLHTSFRGVEEIGVGFSFQF